MTTRKETEGVYKALTEMRVQTPWIEALKSREMAANSAPNASEGVKPDLTPKRMSDSFFRFVCDLTSHIEASDLFFI